MQLPISVLCKLFVLVLNHSKIIISLGSLDLCSAARLEEIILHVLIEKDYPCQKKVTIFSLMTKIFSNVKYRPTKISTEKNISNKVGS